MKKKIKVVALIGEAGSGKSTILKNILAATDWHGIISCTTRKPREKEKEGVDYYFLTEKQMVNKIIKNEMLEITEFNDWFYGTSIDSLDSEEINIGVFNPESAEILSEDPRIDLLVYWIKTSPKQRLIRQLNREKNPNIDEIIRRYKADKKDFYGLNFCEKVINEKQEDVFRAEHYIIEDTLNHFEQN